MTDSIISTPIPNVYIKPLIDYDENTVSKIDLDPQYLGSSDSNNFASALCLLVSTLIKGPVDAFGVLTAKLSLSVGDNFYELKVASDKDDPTKAKITFCNTVTGVALIALPVILDTINGVRVLAELSKSNLLTTAISVVINDAVTYEVIAAAYKTEYAAQYQKANTSGDIIVNATGYSFKQIKDFLYFSDVLKQTQDVYVKTGDDVYKVVRGTEYQNIVNELSRRGYYGGNDSTDPTNDIAELNELYPNSVNYRQNVDTLTNDAIQIAHIYKDEKFILIKNDSVTFPFQGNTNDNIIYLDDKGETSYGDGGNDFIKGGNGNDIIYGDKSAYLNPDGNGNDTIYGGDGADTIHGGDGNDLLYAASNDGSAESSNSPNFVYGDEGNDIIWGGGTSNDILDGGNGNIIKFSRNLKALKLCA